MSQDGDSLMDVLQPYLYTGVNLTTFKFRYEGADTTSNAADDRYDDDDEHFATVHDSLLTLYRGVRLRWRDFGSCQWAGSNLLPTLAKVSILFSNVRRSANHLSTGASCLFRTVSITTTAS